MPHPIILGHLPFSEIVEEAIDNAAVVDAFNDAVSELIDIDELVAEFIEEHADEIRSTARAIVHEALYELI